MSTLAALKEPIEKTVVSLFISLITLIHYQLHFHFNGQAKPDVISNKQVGPRTGLPPVLDTIGRRKRRWIGHTLRRGEANAMTHTLPR